MPRSRTSLPSRAQRVPRERPLQPNFVLLIGHLRGTAPVSLHPHNPGFWQCNPLRPEASAQGDENAIECVPVGCWKETPEPGTASTKGAISLPREGNAEVEGRLLEQTPSDKNQRPSPAETDSFEGYETFPSCPFLCSPVFMAAPTLKAKGTASSSSCLRFPAQTIAICLEDGRFNYMGETASLCKAFFWCLSLPS